MSVYVDDMQRRAKVGRLDAVWSHLMADTHDELVAFARQLGLDPRWIQHEGKPLEHFDLTEPRRQQALRLGAIPIRYGHEGAALTRAKREGRPFDLEAARIEIAAREADWAANPRAECGRRHPGECAWDGFDNDGHATCIAPRADGTYEGGSIVTSDQHTGAS